MLKKGFIKEIEKITYFDLHSSINKIEWNKNPTNIYKLKNQNESDNIKICTYVFNEETFIMKVIETICTNSNRWKCAKLLQL